MSREPKRGLTFARGNHSYRLDGKSVPGVTTIIGVLDKPALPKWAAEQVARHVAENPAAIEALRSLGVDGMVAALKAVPWKKRDDAAERGTTFHDFADRLVRGEEIELDADDPQNALVDAALDFIEAWHIEPILTETAVGSRTHWYAGTLDLAARYRRPDTGHEGVGIFDWKSGKRIYTQACYQLNAYGHAEFYGLDGDEHELPQFDAAFGVQIRADGFDVHEVRYGPEVHDEFLCIRRTFDIHKRAEGDWRQPGSGYVGRAIQTGEAA